MTELCYDAHHNPPTTNHNRQAEPTPHQRPTSSVLPLFRPSAALAGCFRARFRPYSRFFSWTFPTTPLLPTSACADVVLDTPTFGQLRAWPDGAVVFDPSHGSDRRRRRFQPRQPRQPSPAHPLARPADAQRRTGPSSARGSSTCTPTCPNTRPRGSARASCCPGSRDYIFPARTRVHRRPVAAGLAAGSSANSPATARRAPCSTPPSPTTPARSPSSPPRRAGLRITLGQDDDGPQLLRRTRPGEDRQSVSLAQSERLIRRWHGAGNGGLLSYALSPRFAVSCTEKMMRGAAELARTLRHGRSRPTFRKTWVRSSACASSIRRPSDYTDVYDRCGLLTSSHVSWVIACICPSAR